MPVEHGFDPEFGGPQPPGATFSQPLPDTARVGDTVTTAGTALGPLRASAFYVPPSGIPVELRLQSSQAVLNGNLGPGLQGGSDFSMGFKVEAEGVYRVEVNQYDGNAALNRPLYVGAGVPLVPGPLDFYTLPTPGAPVGPDLTDAFIAAVNTDRALYGLHPLSVDPNLTRAAQGYANDMVARNFFGHTGINGDSLLADRLKAAGVPPTSLGGENIALNTTPEALEAGLMASAGHRSDILNSQWRNLGVGITRDAGGNLIGVQEFAAPLGTFDYAVDFFPDVTLDQPLPSDLVVGKGYTFGGKVDTPTRQVFVALQSTGDPNHWIQFDPVAVSADNRFSVNVLLTNGQIGTYGISFFRDNNPGRLANVAVTAEPMNP
jgi:uncharacterized protein YkwD